MVFLNEYDVNIILLNETHLKFSQHLHIPNFYCYRDDRIDGWGGIAVLIHQSLAADRIDISHIHLPEKWQAIIIKFENFFIIGSYKTPDVRFRKEIFRELVQMCDKPFFFIGDLNCQHSLWGSSSNNPNGNRLADLLEEDNLCFLNTGEATRISPPDSNSVPDVAIASPGLAVDCLWEVFPEIGASDHFPFVVCYGQDRNSPQGNDPLQDRSIFNVKKANWEQFNQYIESNINNIPNESYTDFQNLILDAANRFIPKKKRVRFHKPQLPWWDEECSVLIKSKREAVKKFKQVPSLENFINFKKIRAHCKKELKSKKKKSFVVFCSTISPDTPISVMWRKISPMAYETVNMGKEANNQTKFMEWYLNNWSEYKLIFTDGSKDKQGNVGIGIYLNERTQLTARLPSANSICSAEVFAIKKALELIQQNNFTKCLICSDSKSALEKITRSSYKAAIDSQTLQLKQKLCEFDEQHREIKFAWIPSHTGIIGNDRADHLANLGRKLPISEEPKAPFKDFQIKYKENLWIGWENRFQQIGQAKGITYCSQVTVPYKKAWFTKFPNLGRGIITQMCRMRSGHCSVPVHLFRLKVVNSNQCLCGSVGTLQHVLLECTRFQRESQLLRRELEGDPTLTDVLFKNLNSKTLIAVQKFLTSTMTRV
ncbi:uncharacterized protein LOC126878657 [Diabrotica virgifera virgifera]|uniref:RNase H type-1 domain-containing protein n=1 Tax=Diabrotica virgifera virgifera TaxID=50390 RepID=A0ABM5JHP1_DIAVI|nr:uncharacterized protein LOC126878657 [Diabrotica virgifera virgifera]